MAGEDAAARGRAAGTLKIKMIGSLIGCTDKQRATVRGLGLRRMHQVVERADTPQVRGMVRAVPHLVAITDHSGVRGSVRVNDPLQSRQRQSDGSDEE